MMAYGGQPQPEAQPKLLPRLRRSPAPPSVHLGLLRTRRWASRRASSIHPSLPTVRLGVTIPEDSCPTHGSTESTTGTAFARLAGHIGVIERDRARWLAGQGRLQQASEAYARLATDLASLFERLAGPARRIPDLIVAAAQRDAARLRALNAGATGGAAAPRRVSSSVCPTSATSRTLMIVVYEMRVELCRSTSRPRIPFIPTRPGATLTKRPSLSCSPSAKMSRPVSHRLGVSEQCPAAAIHGRRDRRDAHRRHAH